MSDTDKKTRLPKISEEEKSLVQKWLQKEHTGHNQLNARWIKGGGGHGSGMTESKAVKTSGAYESLANYVNEKLQSKPKAGDDGYWTAKIASTRFTAAFKAYTEATKIGNISDSAAGASEEQVKAQADYNAALLAQKVKKCPMFLVFNALYAEHPSVNPVVNVGMKSGQVVQGDIDGERNDNDDFEAEEGTTKKEESKESMSSNASKETKSGFKLKEGAKKVDFTTAWATTMGQAKAARLEFEKRKEKREREEKRKDRKVQEKKIRSELLITLLGRNCTEDQIKTYMRLAGHCVDET